MTMVDDFADTFVYAADRPDYGAGFVDCLDGVVDFLNRNLDDHPEKLVETLSNVLAVFREHVA